MFSKGATDFGNRFQNGIGIMAILKDTVKKQMSLRITKQLINLALVAHSVVQLHARVLPQQR